MNAPTPFKESMEGRFVQGYRLCAGFLAGFFLMLFPWRLVHGGQRPHGAFLAWEGLVIACLLLAFTALANRLKVWLGAVENLALLLVAAGLVNNLSLLLLARDSDQAANFMLMLTGCGLIFQSRTRFFLVQGIVALAWAATCPLVLPWNHLIDWAFPVLCSAMLGMAIHFFLNSLMKGVAHYHLRDQILLRQRARLVRDLKEAMEGMKTLRGLIPICAQCKKVRDDGGYWQQVETFVREHTGAEFTHGLCPECSASLQDEFEQSLPPET
jgi:membrane protein implicated in regulation of membrane protease activity